LGTNPYDLFHPDDVSHIRTQSHDLALNRDTVKTMEYRIRTKNGGYIWFDTNTQPIYDDRGQMARLLTVSRDITDRKNLEAQLRQAQKMEALGTLAGGVAHDFNNLLQVIQGYTQMLLLDHQSGDPAHGSLTEIQKAGDRAAKLVQQLLAFSRKADTRLEPIDLNQEIRQAEKVLVRTIPKMIQVEFRPSDDLWPVLADGIQIEQIVLNLGANAADAMPDGGLLIVETQNVVLDADYCRDHLDALAGRYVMLSVSDTGHGMDRRTLDRIFEPFFTTKDVGQGTGLGLASVFGIVKNHQGYITCYSELGQGTVFKIYLPAIDGALPTEEFSEGYSPGRGAETVLIIDDEAAIRDFVVQALERFGYTTLTASTGEEGLAVYDQNTGRIDLVILDLGMPGMGGRRCLIELIERAPGLPVIIASGYTANGPVKNALAAGAAGFIPKPYQLMELIGVVRRTLDRSDDG
jgi:signal transduction histidine kinase/ActR/RegA family two-component response regulator